MAVIVFTGLFEKNCVYWLPFAWLLLENSINCVGLSCLSIAGLLCLCTSSTSTRYRRCCGNFGLDGVLGFGPVNMGFYCTATAYAILPVALHAACYSAANGHGLALRGATPLRNAGCVMSEVKTGVRSAIEVASCSCRKHSYHHESSGSGGCT